MAGKFELAVERFVAKAGTRADLILRKIALEIFSSVVAMMPVDTGRARGSWLPSIGTMRTDVAGGAPRSAETVQTDIRETVARFGAGQVAYLANNLPYIGVLEYGLYPDPVRFGTYLKAGQIRWVGGQRFAGPGHVKLSEGGYSRQAPAGMVRVTLQRFNAIVDQAVQEARRERP